MGKQFELNSGAEIPLSPDLDLCRVGLTPQFRESLFRGTRIATGRRAHVNDSEDAKSHGLYGLIVTGGELLFEGYHPRVFPAAECRASK